MIPTTVTRRHVLGSGLALASALALRGGLAGPAAPPSGSGIPNATLADLLRFVPTPLSEDEANATPLCTFVDFAAQLNAFDLTAPSQLEDQDALSRWLNVVMALASPSTMARNAFDPNWRAYFGFALFQVDTGIEFGVPPYSVVCVRGRFDFDEIESALVTSGYHVETDSNGVIYSLQPDTGINVRNDSWRLARGSMNNVGWLPDGTLIATSTLERLRQILETAASGAPSLASDPTVSALVGAIPTPLASAMLMNGGDLSYDVIGPMLDSGGEIDEASTAVASAMAEASVMPPIILALTGITPGGPLEHPDGTVTSSEAGAATAAGPDSTWWWALLTVDAESATRIPDVVRRRVETLSSSFSKQPYAERMQIIDAVVTADPPVAAIEIGFIPPASSRNWLAMIVRRDIGFLGW